MTSKRSHEGYFLLDHSNSPGVSDADMVKHGLPTGYGRKKFESATFTCNHCERVVAIVYKGLTRHRDCAWCKKCDHYLCDDCGTALHKTGVCYPFKAMIEDLRNKHVQTGRVPSPSEVFQSPTIVVP
jgi:hypothetical protein